jgi:hypothetical protein
MDRPLTSVSDIIDSTMLPDPTIPIPFEKFAVLKDSDDMLTRAAFWCFMAAWDLDKQGKSAPAGLAVEARHDGHQLRAITQELAIRDAVLITRRDALDNMYRPSGALIWLYIAMAFLLGIVVALWASGWLW